MNVKSTNYGRIAKMYNSITKCISMNGNERSQNYFLKYVSKDLHILNVGCGSISFSSELSKCCNHITAVDISSEMIAIAEQEVVKNGNSANIKFVCQDIMEWNPGIKYNVVFTNFFLNTFAWEDCEIVMKHLMGMVKDNGLLCIADEIEGKYFFTKAEQLIFRPLLTYFHHILADHPLHPIYDYSSFIFKHGFVEIDAQRDKSDYICSWTYAKKPITVES